MTRLHPFDFVFAEMASTRFPEIRDEAPEPSGRPGPRPLDQATFARLPSVQQLLRDMGAYDAGDETPSALAAYLAVLFAAFRFWAAGSRTLAPDRTRLIEALDAATPPDVDLPDDAVYVQLPLNRIWGQTAPDAPHEPMDGMFVVPGPETVEVVAVLGLRPDRAGFSQIAVASSLADFGGSHKYVRPGSPVLAPVMDGGTEAQLRSVTREAELLYITRVAMVSARQ
jgi:hypothetical protein